MTTLQYAPDGYLFLRVQTPQVFREYLIPTTGALSAAEREHYEELQVLAERHATSILGSTFRAG